MKIAEQMIHFSKLFCHFLLKTPIFRPIIIIFTPGKVVFQDIARPAHMAWDSPLAAFNEALEHEKNVRNLK